MLRLDRRGDRFGRLVEHLAQVDFDAVALERIAVLEAITREREIVMAEMAVLIDDVMDRSFERVEEQVAAQLTRMLPLALAVMVGPFVLGLVAGIVLWRRTA